MENITAEELRDIQDSTEPYTLIDTRNEDDFDEWHIKGAVNYDYSINDPESKVTYKKINERFGLNTEDQIIAICAKGKTSGKFAKLLDKEGFKNVKVVKGGMQAWSSVYDVVNLATENDDLILIQLQRRAKGCLGYLIGSKSQGKAIAIDVSRYINEFIEVADSKGLDIIKVFDTHFQADHISGGPRLAKELDIPYYLGFNADKRDPKIEYLQLELNQVFEFGNIIIKALHTPGHTSEMTSFLINDEYLLTGDALFVESIGRTELEFVGEEAAKGAQLQYNSLHKTILSLPDHIRVLPSHFTVTDEGESIDVIPGKPIFSTIGYLRENNDVLNLEKDAFISYISEELPSKPPNYEKIISINLGREKIEDEEEAINLELGPNRCAASEKSLVKNN